MLQFGHGAKEQKIRRLTRRAHPQDGGPVKPMAFVDGWVMCRRPGRVPFVVCEKDWLTWPKFEPHGKGRD